MPVKHTANLLEKENRQFKKLLDIQKRIGSERQIDKLLPLIIEEISELLLIAFLVVNISKLTSHLGEEKK